MPKSIIDVVLNDGDWLAFQKQVDAHQKKLKAMPHQWGDVGKAIVQGAGQAAKMLAALKEQGAALKNANGLVGKMNLALKAADRSLSSMGRGAMNFARHIKDATKSLLSWLPMFSIMSGLMGAGGLFGLSRLASNVAQGSMTAMGAGTSYGSSKAAEISYGQALGGGGASTALLNRIAEEQRSGGVMFRRLGMSEEQWKGRQSGDVLGPMLSALQAKYKQGPEATAKQRMEAFAPGMDFNTILRISQMNVGELQKEYDTRKKMLSLSQGTQDSWARFSRSLETAAEKLENIFARALGGPLLGALEQFTSGLLRAADLLMNSPMVRGLIAGAGKAAEKGAKYLMSDDFQRDLKTFLEKMSEVADALSTVAEALIDITGTKEKRFNEDLAKEKSQVEQYWADRRKKRSEETYERVRQQYPQAHLPPLQSRLKAEVHVQSSMKAEVYVSNASGGNINAHVVGVGSSTYRGK